MPRANPFDLEFLGGLEEVEVKKLSETTTTSLFDPDNESTPGREARFRLCSFVITSSAETVVTLEDGTTSIGVFFLAAKTPLSVTLSGQGYLSAANGAELKFKSLNTAKFTAAFYGAQE